MAETSRQVCWTSFRLIVPQAVPACSDCWQGLRDVSGGYTPYGRDVFSAGSDYHIYNRGAGKSRMFFGEGNSNYLLGLVKRYHRRYGAAMIAYCLMPNHYHFLIRQETDLPLSKFMNVTFNACTQAVNVQQGRSGTLFEGRFRHKSVHNWESLIRLCCYIHLNPVKAGLVGQPEDWPYSNFR